MKAVLKLVGDECSSCLLFPSLQSAFECVAYSTSPLRNDGNLKTAVPGDSIAVRSFTALDKFFAVVFPTDKVSVVKGFWSTPGVGVSSRFAEANLSFEHQLTEIPVTDDKCPAEAFEGPTHERLRENIYQAVTRAMLRSEIVETLSRNDIYLYPTGMAAIYKPHTYMLKANAGTTILFGMAFMNTLTAFEDFGSNFKFFGLGNDQDLDEMAVFLQMEAQRGRKVQAIWTEFPANPLLVTPNITRLRALADEYDTILAIDDTIGSWANVDVFPVADMVVTSLTKSFNGYADAIAGSVILNPESKKYKYLKPLFDTHYVPELYTADASTIERNSQDYLIRSAKLNENARTLVHYLTSCTSDPESAVRAVYHPSISPSERYYKEFMRPAIRDFTPGYGCLFSVELDSLETTTAFYDNLNVHKGPHLGAPFTLAFAYTACAYWNKLAWAANYGLKPTQVRITAGLEDTGVLLEDFRVAVEAANRVKHRHS